jgi:hypothetical protein
MTAKGAAAGGVLSEATMRRCDRGVHAQALMRKGITYDR